jgi:SAM-dependent methyltransferase
METITCPFCDEPGDPRLHEGGWTARRCPRCRLVFLSPRPSAEDTAALYVGDEAHWPASSHLMDYGSPTSALETRRTLSMLRRHAPAGRLLEIGPGSGALLAAARAEGYDVEAVELNPAQVAFIRDTLRVPCADNLDAVTGTFDVVYHRDVLSHFSDPIEVFERIHSLLAPGGYHVFETGSGDFRPRYASWFSTFQFPDHLFFFSRESLALLLSRTGYSLVATQRYALTPFLFFQRAVGRLRGHQHATLTGPGDPVAPAEGNRGRSAAALAWLKYGLRYWGGALAPKQGRPQTMVVVARRA